MIFIYQLKKQQHNSKKNIASLIHKSSFTFLCELAGKQRQKSHRGIRILTVSCQGTMHPQIINGMMPRPTRMTEILEAFHRTAEKRSRVDMALATHCIFKIRIYLHFLGEFWGPNFNEWGLNSFHETSVIIECNTPRSWKKKKEIVH